MTDLAPRAPWHRESYERFLKERLPALLASRLPLAHYRAEPSTGNSWTVTLAVRSNGAEVATVFKNLPGPDEEGLFQVDGKRRVVLPVATEASLTSDFLCVGEQLERLVESRLGEAPANLRWDEPLLRNWVGLDETLPAFLRGQLDREAQALFGWATVQILDETNWLASKTHLRRIAVPKRRPEVTPTMPRRTELVDASERGRTCPFETPEGINIGRLLHVARGAAIRNRKLVVVDESPAAGLGLTAGMVPLLEHSDPNRLLMGVNMLRQWLPRPDPEPALVQSGFEPHAPGFWCGRNLLTAFAAWGPETFEDGIAVSESAARRLAATMRSEDGTLELPPIGIGVGQEKTIAVGDKLSNRHGTKGVVAAIIPDERMPHTPDGKAVELVFSFIGLHTRMNFGQVREALLGLLASREGQPVVSPPLGGMSDAQLQQRLAAAGLPENGMMVLNDGRGGPQLGRPVTVGYVYWGLLHHLARKKLNAKPQRASHLQYQVLRDAGAVETILEQHQTQCVASTTPQALAARLAQGPIEQSRAPSPAFTRLQRSLAVAGIGAELRDEQVRFHLSTPGLESLALACPVRHPWLPDRPLTHLGGAPTGAAGVSPAANRPTGGTPVAPSSPLAQAVSEANAHVRRLLDTGAPRSLVDQAVSRLQTAVDELFSALLGPEHLQMAQSVAMSGHAVIAPGGDLRITQCGLAEELAWALFGPLVAREAGPEAVRAREAGAGVALDRLMAESWVLLSREPAVLPTSILAFHPVRIPDLVIRLHPLCCALTNADYDGDQMSVYLPVTAEGQREAGEKLTVAAHLARHPELLRWALPANEALWGLAWLNLSEAGRARIAGCRAGILPALPGQAGRLPHSALTPGAVAGSDHLLTRDSLHRAMRQTLAQAGPERTLEILEALLRLGLEAARRSGASLNPFAHRHLPPPVTPDPLTWENAKACREDLMDALLARTDYDALDVGPQLLAVKTGSRGHALQLVMGLICRTIQDYDGGLKHFNESLLGGLSAEAAYTSYIGARIGIAELCLRPLALERSAYGLAEPRGPEGYHVLARAMRSTAPGPVFARAAANEEVDPLADADSRLFVGLRPK